jgi:DNA-binding transcriptional ArsR family regulator
MDRLKLEKLLLKGDKAVNDNTKLSLFFNNSSMARMLDVLLNNPDLKMTIEDILYKAGLSRKAIQVNMPLLTENNLLIEEIYRPYKFYRLNKKNSLVKQITKFRDILLVNNVFIEKRGPRKPDQKKSNR